MLVALAWATCLPRTYSRWRQPWIAALRTAQFAVLPARTALAMVQQLQAGGGGAGAGGAAAHPARLLAFLLFGSLAAQSCVVSVCPASVWVCVLTPCKIECVRACEWAGACARAPCPQTTTATTRRSLRSAGGCASRFTCPCRRSRCGASAATRAPSARCHCCTPPPRTRASAASTPQPAWCRCGGVGLWLGGGGGARHWAGGSFCPTSCTHARLFARLLAPPSCPPCPPPAGTAPALPRRVAPAAP